jgi:hypothetical protein
MHQLRISIIDWLLLTDLRPDQDFFHLYGDVSLPEKSRKI